ncbi:MAG TPA: hypothetical protein DDW30_09150 [Clostridiales bacterium]|nr:hypothetical protein [Clostridiales bacterium]
MIEAVQLRLAGYEDRPAADLRLVNGRVYGIYDTGDGMASALLRALAGAEFPAEGTVRVGGFDTLTEQEKVGLCLGFCSSESEYYDSMTVWDLMQFVAGMRGEDDRRGARDIHAILDSLDIDDLRNRRLGTLDPDDRRRAGLAQALIGNPDMLFLDNPTKGLKPDEAQALREDIARLAEDGKTVFLATDSAAEAETLCNRFLFCDGEGISGPMEKEKLTEGTPTPARALFLKLNARGTGEEGTEQ